MALIDHVRSVLEHLKQHLPVGFGAARVFAKGSLRDHDTGQPMCSDLLDVVAHEASVGVGSGPLDVLVMVG
jgi:hypothetical protein